MTLLWRTRILNMTLSGAVESIITKTTLLQLRILVLFQWFNAPFVKLSTYDSSKDREHGVARRYALFYL